MKLPKSVKILALADTHLQFPKVVDLPDADVFVHTGDWTNIGYRHTAGEFQDFLAFLGQILERYPNVLALHGNHDLGFDNARWTNWGVTPIDGITWEHSSGLTFHGVALTPAYHFPEMMLDWKYMTVDEDEEDSAWDFGPVDVVISHGPPFRHLDKIKRGQCVGSKPASSYIFQHQPKLFICGHIHEAAGEKFIGSTHLINVAQGSRLIELEIDATS